mmetsp:Transcript_108201/g.258227  ORF Transcript_108201/g.258227 Transcript_108201/m.258227 type:complete len:213 (+) Transcript_108201:436-1074(+)
MISLCSSRKKARLAPASETVAMCDIKSSPAGSSNEPARRCIDWAAVSLSWPFSRPCACCRVLAAFSAAAAAAEALGAAFSVCTWCASSRPVLLSMSTAWSSLRPRSWAEWRCPCSSAASRAKLSTVAATARCSRASCVEFTASCSTELWPSLLAVPSLCSQAAASSSFPRRLSKCLWSACSGSASVRAVSSSDFDKPSRYCVAPSSLSEACC